MATDRFDEWLVKKGYFESLELAQKSIQMGHIRDARSGEVLDKPGVKPKKNLEVKIESFEKYVSRGGLKLEAFLNEAGISVKGLCVLDVGSSTGGFTDCCLQNGATEVYAVDVGTHQLHEKIRNDTRVHVWEQTDIRAFDFKALKRKPDLVVVDVAFISLRIIVPFLLKELPRARFVFLFKPQFEVDRDVPKARGVAPQEEASVALEEMLQFFRSLGLNIRMVRASALRGAKGNQETFIMADQIIPQHIFRTYDIRGHADRELSNELFFSIGISFGQRLSSALKKSGRVGVGRDARISSGRLFESFTKGLKISGHRVIDLGVVPTPMTYFAHYEMGCDAIAQITASHNPKQDNGLKMMMLKNTLFGDEIRGFYNEVLKVTNTLPEGGPMVDEDSSVALRQAYLQFLKRSFGFKRKFRIVLDCGNGMVGAIARDVFSPLCSDLEILYEEIDCRFPHHEADPTVPANLIDLQRKVQERKADLGFAFDGDGDRLGVVTRTGRILWGDEIVMLLSELLLQQRPGSTIIGEVKCSQKLFQMIADRGGKPLMYKTGHSLIKKKMKELGAPLAGEMSGHLFFADRFFGFDDATYAALRVLEVIDEMNLDLDDWISKFPKSFITPEIRVTCDEEEKASLVEKAEQALSQMPGTKTSTIDGIRVNFDDGSWALVRASNTQAVLVVRVEAPSPHRLREVVGFVESALGKTLEVEAHV